MTLKDIAIFKLKPLIANFNAKLSAATENNLNSQILCLVHTNNDLFLRYTNYESVGAVDESSGEENPVQVTVKLVPWFNEHGKVVKDIAFEPSNERLLVLCDDNTLHVVPALAIVQEQQQATATASTTATKTTTTTTTSNTIITSYVIPFVGPHECPNPRTCPNNFYRPGGSDLEQSLKTHSSVDSRKAPAPTLDDLYSKQTVDRLLSAREATSTYFNAEKEEEEEEDGDQEDVKEQKLTKEAESTTIENSGIVCPYPTAVIWWQTKRRQDRAIVGYSDGSVCFLSLTPNCPFIANTTLADAVASFDICRDTTGHTVTLLINTAKNTQWKLLLEEEQSRYIFPGDSPITVADNVGAKDGNSIEQDWQFVVAPQITVTSHSDNSPGGRNPDQTVPKLFPGGISYLREIGTRKIGALKQRLSAEKPLPVVEDQEAPESVDKLTDNNEADGWDDDDDDLTAASHPQLGTFVDVLETPSVSPELISSSHGPRIVVKNHNTRTALFALTDRQVSVHNLNMDPEPFCVFCLPENCQDVLVTQNTIFTVQKVSAGQRNGRVGVDVSADGEELMDHPEDKQVIACGVVSKTLAVKNKETDVFEDRALVTYFPFYSENVIDVHGQLIKQGIRQRRNISRREMSPMEKKSDKLTVKEYVKQRAQFEGGNEEVVNEVRILETSFPAVDFESCFVVTDKNAYAVELNDNPEVIFMNFAKQSMWSSCKYFCDIFNISMAQCIEYVGDELLRQHKVTQALVTYNVAQIPPIKTALKLATYGESNALLHLCAMALKCIYVLKASRPSGGHAKCLMEDLPLRTVPQRDTGGKMKFSKKQISGDLNVGRRCSDFSYEHDEVGMDVQMSYSSQFHLSNLLFLTLCERTVTEKNYFPLWSFVQTNQRFHTSLASTILAQGGMYSTAVLLAKVRGASLDVFVALVKAMRQELAADLNYLVYNLSEDGMFSECITYLSTVAVEYFVAVAGQIERFSVHVVDRLVQQFNPFAACFRPIVSRLSGLRRGKVVGVNEKEALFGKYCRVFIEAFLAVLVKSVEMREGVQSQLLNGLKSVNIRYEVNCGLVGGDKLETMAAGYAHSCRVVDGKAYIWGSNQIPYVVDDNVTIAPGIESSSLGNQPKMVAFLSNLCITVLSVHCGRTHTLLYTDNGLYALGGNALGQLGVGAQISQSLHPMLVETLMDKKLELIAVGQYHNAVVADGQVYVWGWGVYGQLGNGRIDDVQVPTVLEFFNGKKIKQISLGHVHSLVLCEGDAASNGLEELYVFGSNYFGQLGTGQTAEPGEEKGMSKAMVPIRLELNERIRCIHTRFFVNFAVTESNDLLTWGASPQALRVINQARKRARAQIRSELSKEKEALESQQQQTEAEQSKENAKPLEELKENTVVSTGNKEESKKRPKLEAKKSSRRHSLSGLKVASRKSPARLHRSPSDESLPQLPNDPPPSLKRRGERSPDVQGEKREKDKKEGTVDLTDLDEWTEHLQPSKVDTTNVEEEDILEVSSGLYHFALRTTTGVFTWGKNIEKQLGNDSSRADVPIPTRLESIKRPLRVNCGADFTLVLVDGDGQEQLLAFGNNNMGQCGRETGDKGAMMGKWVRLKISKRHIRIPDGSACVSAPTEVVFNGSDQNQEGRKRPKQVPQIKSLPLFKRKFLATSEYLREFVRVRREEEVAVEAEKMDTEPEERQRVVSLAGEKSSLKLSLKGESNTSPVDGNTPDEDDEDQEEDTREEKLVKGKITSKQMQLKNGLPTDTAIASEFIHYCLSLFHGIYDCETVGKMCSFAEFQIRLKMLQSKFFEAFQIALQEVANNEREDVKEKVRQSLVLLEFFTKDENLIPMHEEDLKYFIQEIFVLFIERGWDLGPLEEYFKEQLNSYVVPLAYVLFFDGEHDLVHNLNGDGGGEEETVSLSVSDGGGLEHEGVGGNGTKQLRDSVLLKYRTFFNHLECAEQKYRIRGSSRIFERVSVMFNALICQRVVEIFEQVVEE